MSQIDKKQFEQKEDIDFAKKSIISAASVFLTDGRQYADQVFCKINDHCLKSTYCCSNYSCT